MEATAEIEGGSSSLVLAELYCTSRQSGERRGRGGGGGEDGGGGGAVCT